MRKQYILYIIVILLSLISIINTNNTSALSYQSSVGVGFTFLPTLNVSLSSNNLTINNLVPGGNAVDSNTITINVSTNIAEGYNLYATVGSDSSSGNNNANANTNVNNGYNTANLVNTVDNSYAFTPLSSNVLELSNFTNNAWGYSYSNDSGTTWISGDYNNASTGYNGLPLYTNTGIKLVEKADNTNSTVDFKIAARASSTQPSGEYTNVINFTAVSNTIPTTMLDAFIASGAKMHNGYFKMQDMTPTICRSIDTDGEKGMQLIDVRDDKVYWVAKLKDGNCWMTQNLDLDLTSNPNANNYITLTSENTDLTDTTSAAYQDGYTVSETGVITWVPERDTIAYNNLNSTTWQNDKIHPYSYDYLDNNGGLVYPDNNVTNSHGASGNYYNRTAGIASNDSTETSKNPANSICPKGWRLPNAPNQEFGNLLVQYDIIETNTSTSYIDGVSSVNSMGAAPLYFVRSGFINGLSGRLVELSERGAYMSSTYKDSLYNTVYLSFQSSNIDPQSYYYSFWNCGWSIRCLAQ